MNWKVQKLVKIIIPVIIFSFLGWQVFRDWSLVSRYFEAIKFHYLLFSLPIFLLIYPEGALCWWMVLQRMGIKIPLLVAIRIWIIANTSRYIPGKIWQYLGRGELAKREAGIARGKTIFSLFLEIFLVITAAGLVSILALPVIGFQNINKGFIIFLLPLSLIFLHPKFSNFILFLIAKFSRNRINVSFPLTFGQSLSIFPLYILNFLINGLALYFIVVSIYSNNITTNFYHILTFSGFYAFSWVVGFLSFFAPGGLGVTEITLSYLLSFLMPLSLASSITILYRFLLTIAEFLVFGFFLKIGGKRS